VLVIRAWLEETLEGAELRARITRKLDIISARTMHSAARSKGEILRTVEDWLREFVDGVDGAD